MGLKFGIPRIILKASLRLLFLRAVLASSFVCAAYSIWALLSLSFDKTVAAAVVFTIFTFSHHIANALGPKCVSLPVWLDLVITLCEIGFYIFVLTLPRVWHYTIRSRWFPKRAVVALLCAWLLALALMGLFTLKLLHVVRPPPKVSWSKYLSGTVDVAKSTEDEDGVDFHKLSIPMYFFKALFGRKVWEQRIPGEGQWIVVLRGILSFMIIITLVVFGFYQITLMPISEMGMLPNKEFRASAIPSTFTSSVPLAWNLIMVWQRRPGAAKSLLQVAEVKPIWHINNTHPLEGPQCELVRDPFGQSTTTEGDPWTDPWVANQKSRDLIPDDYDVVVYRCPPRLDVKNPNSFQEHDDHRSDTRPDLELTVNFTELITPGEGLGSNGDTIRDSVQVYLGLSNRTHDTITTTAPTPLFPGLNLLSVASLAVRQRLEPAALSSLGFDIQKTFMIAEMTYMSNPFTAAARPNVSTMRITAEFSDLSEWRIIQDFRDKSVLNGMSAAGGLGSLLNAFFSILLGTSLLRAIFRTRPFNILGLVHRLDSETEKIRIACTKQYPKLQKKLDKFKDKDERGITSLILDALLDIDDLKDPNYAKEVDDPKGSGNMEAQKGGGESGEDLESQHSSDGKKKASVSVLTTVLDPQSGTPIPTRQPERQ